MPLWTTIPLFGLMLVVIVFSWDYGRTHNQPPACPPGAVAVHHGNNGAWACVMEVK